LSDFDELFDFVIVGSGGGSMCGALYLRSQDRRVLILEKTALVGGTTACSGGVMWIPNNPYMKREGVEDSYEKAAAYLDAVVGDHEDEPGATRVRRHTFLIEAPRMLEFLCSRGIEFTRVKYWPDYYDELPGGSIAGRNVVARLFDANELGPWKDKLRAGFLPLPVTIEEALELPKLPRYSKFMYLILKLKLRAPRPAVGKACGVGRDGVARAHAAGGAAFRRRDSY